VIALGVATDAEAIAAGLAELPDGIDAVIGVAGGAAFEVQDRCDACGGGIGIVQLEGGQYALLWPRGRKDEAQKLAEALHAALGQQVRLTWLSGGESPSRLAHLARYMPMHGRGVSVWSPLALPADLLAGEFAAPPPRNAQMPELTPGRADTVRLELELFDDAKLAVEGLVVDTKVEGWEQKNRSARWLVDEAWVLFTAEVGELAGGEWLAHCTRNYRAQELTFHIAAMTRVSRETLVLEDRRRIAEFWFAHAEQAGTRRDASAAIAHATRGLAVAMDDDRGKLLAFRARCLVEVHDHEAALVDWDELLTANPDHHSGLLGRANTRIAVGDRAGAITDVRHATELGIDGAAAFLARLAPPPPPSNRVHHKVYGEGKIVRRLEGDKLEIEFASAGKKTLLARFVEPLPEPG
jgi:hypothetical protein